MSPDISNQQKWRNLIDQKAAPRVPNEERLAVRREKLIAAVAAYFAAKSPSRPIAGRRSRTSNVVQTRGHLKNFWKCDEAWLKKIDELGTQFPVAPSKYELSKFLDFPPVNHSFAPRPNRKKPHVA